MVSFDTPNITHFSKHLVQVDHPFEKPNSGFFASQLQIKITIYISLFITCLPRYPVDTTVEMTLGTFVTQRLLKSYVKRKFML